MRYHTPALILACGLFLAGCEQPKPAANEPAANSSNVIRERALREFTLADYYKPANDGAGQAELQLAPLIVQQAGGGRIAPVVHFQDSVARLQAGACNQRSFLWRYDAPAAGGLPKWRAVRMTFDPRGNPVLWESLSNDNSVRVLFVAKSLEEKAATRFGPPLEGRQFSIERSASDQPEVVVARVLADGPEPMGPFVYLDTQDVLTTVLCRCMPSQFSEVREMITYTLAPLGAPTAQPGARKGLPASLCDVFPELSDCARPDWLEIALRLPSDF